MEADPPLHTAEPCRCRSSINRAFAGVYSLALIALFYRHARNLAGRSKSDSYSIPFAFSFLMFLSDLVLAFMWITAQPFRFNPIHRKEFPANLGQVIGEENFPALDVFICTADPHKEPPASVVSTALSLMAYDYQADKVSVYVSDDGGSVLTLFAFVEVAEFGRHWLPFCRNNKIAVRSPEQYFASQVGYLGSQGNDLKKITIFPSRRSSNSSRRGSMLRRLGRRTRKEKGGTKEMDSRRCVHKEEDGLVVLRV